MLDEKIIVKGSAKQYKTTSTKLRGRRKLQYETRALALRLRKHAQSARPLISDAERKWSRYLATLLLEALENADRVYWDNEI